MERKTVLEKTRKTTKHVQETKEYERIYRLDISELVIEKWEYGYVFIGNYVNEKTINYISKYMLKDDLNNREFTGKV